MKPKLRKRKAKPMKKTPKRADKKIALVTKLAAAADAAKPAAPAPKSDGGPAKPENRRITPGAAVREWRVVPSLRQSQPGYFLQGGHYQKTSRGNSFIVGEEVHFVELEKAKEALAAKVGAPAPKAAAPAPAKKAAKDVPAPKAPAPAPASAPAPR
jgi:hypothetical protein